MAPSVKTYPRYLYRGRLYALSKFEITCVSCGRKYHSKSHAYNHVITHQCVQPHGGNNGTELFVLDAVAPNEMIAGRSEKLLQYIASYYVWLKFATSNIMQMNVLSNKLPFRRALRWLVREHSRKLTNRTKQVTDHLDTLGRMERWRSVLLPLKKERLATEVQVTDHLDTLGRMERWRSVLLPLKKERLATEVQVTDHLDTLGRMERWRSVLLPLKKERLATEVQSTTLDMVKQWATDVGGGDCNSHDDSKGHLKAQPFWT
ncbi:hypothetical protein VOLCADRAFT_108600 [Volvox carteri f. nagariensis]|uniref:C2H2-type domain-containing protein n=1 Tax=Volvox carteri f. nagariensis TaxID=3068 RepID=D8UL69_VOLCA|nr:uncharacterized protein VOLCADRAFT_108600 [Volvox carteri f. nagariensis]EFJ39530.1 hypothetical protein VOLCADRAFT_108600 [Volvox carteri f. nagariensis]|eukprot:XP_002959405.1 hypothetical protein VOLCADRAFT_108600 [Volvox carteri f. nagariensis]